MPDSLIKIENNAFENCTNLYSVNMPESVKTI